MANILCVYENRIATVEIINNYFNEHEKYDPRIVTRFIPIIKLSVNDLSWCDVLYMIRPNNGAFARIAHFVKPYGIKIIFYLDDDLFHLPRDYADIPWRKKGLASAVKNSDIIVSSSPYICKNYSKRFGISRNVFVDTAVPINDIRQHKENINERVKIVYVAGLAHKPLFEQFIKPILKKLDRKYGDKISLTFIGVHPELEMGNYRMKIKYIEPMTLNDYRKRMEVENFDIGLAPLVTSEFTKCKYYNKFIEYSIFGVVGIYSNTEPYTFIIKDKENGLLVEDNPNEWFEALCNAIENKELIKKCREKSYELLLSRFGLEKIADNLSNEIWELIEPHKEKNVKGMQLSYYKIIYMFSRLGDWLYKTRFFFKKGGIKEVYKGVKRFISTSKIVK